MSEVKFLSHLKLWQVCKLLDDNDGSQFRFSDIVNGNGGWLTLDEFEKLGAQFPPKPACKFEWRLAAEPAEVWSKVDSPGLAHAFFRGKVVKMTRTEWTLQLRLGVLYCREGDEWKLMKDRFVPHFDFLDGGQLLDEPS